ncbi:MAG: hypothetical protein JW863_14195, partial [Chitinispirillaceae bacterium]|nr:hypothetical protein [Chitinispirillaceae bacterium]
MAAGSLQKGFVTCQCSDSCNSVEKEQVDDAVKEIDKKYKLYLSDNPTGKVEGKLKLRINFSPAGLVDTIKIETTSLKNAELEAIVKSAFRKIKLMKNEEKISKA